MEYAIKKLDSKIHYFEDMLLRSKDVFEIQRLRDELAVLRKKRQYLMWQEKKNDIL